MNPATQPKHGRRATLIGLSAVLVWSTLAIFGALAGDVPPLQLVAMAFTIVFVLAAAIWLARGENPLDHMLSVVI